MALVDSASAAAKLRIIPLGKLFWDASRLNVLSVARVNIAAKSGALFGETYTNWDQAATPLTGRPIAKFEHMMRRVEPARVEAMQERFGLEAEVRDGFVTFGVADGERFVPRLFDELDVPIRSVETTRPSLDDVFLNYTGRTIRDAEATAGDRNRSFMQAARR